MIDKNFTSNTLADLVKINSVNPDLSKDGAGEEEIALYIDGILKSIDVESHVSVLKPGRVNVTGTLKGTGGGTSLMINAHTDTVGVEHMDEPFSARIENGKLYGRGSYDMKGSIAAMLAMAKAIRENKIEHTGDIVLTFVADEEYESIGTQEVIKQYKTDAAIVTEPTDLDVCVAHRGFGIYEIKTKGKIAHGGRHQEGIDANTKMGTLLVELEKLADRLPDEKHHALCGQASMHVPLIKGGQSLFIYSGECTINAERRTLPGEREVEVLQDLQNIIDMLSERDKDFNAEIKPLIWRAPYEVSRDAAIVKKLSQCAAKVLGCQPAYIGHTWWEDSAIIGKTGTDTVIIGPKGGGIHQEVEWVEIQSVIDLATILLKTADDYCGGK